MSYKHHFPLVSLLDGHKKRAIPHFQSQYVKYVADDANMMSGKHSAGSFNPSDTGEFPFLLQIDLQKEIIPVHLNF